MDSSSNPFRTCFVFWLMRRAIPVYVSVSVSSLCTVAGFDEVILCLDLSNVDMPFELVRDTYFPEVSRVVTPQQFFDEEALSIYSSLHGRFEVVNKADFFRIYALYRFGGFYCDTDTLALRSFRGLDVGTSYVSSEDGVHLSNGILYAEPGHPAFKFMYENFVERWQPDTFNLVGSKWFTELKEYFHVDWDRNHHYFINWQEWRKLFQPFPESVESLLAQDVFSVHLWGTTLSRNRVYPSPDYVRKRPETLFSKMVKFLAQRSTSLVCREMCGEDDALSHV